MLSGSSARGLRGFVEGALGGGLGGLVDCPARDIAGHADDFPNLGGGET